ncbi:hypothetical protein [Sphingomonas bacterium]|uniref:hypothetical protein n=1 Tax=Sphingomonas bacterium TaxID=1895847 RepID=UPI0015769245|nr:hypothetical protein [Sphingomonas bacterium]
MRIHLILAAVALSSPALADPLQDQLLAGMRATRTTDVAYVATSHFESTGNAAHDTVTRHDGQGHFTLQSVDGKPPSPKQLAQAAKNRTPTPSYTENAKWFGAPATRVAGPNGAVVYHFAHLPPGTVKIGSHDASAQCQADAEVATATGQPYIARVRFASTASFRMMLVAKVERFAVTSAYAPLADGRVFPTDINTRFEGSMMGKSGALTSRTRFTDAHPAH